MSYLNWVDAMNFAAVCPQYDILAQWRLKFVNFEWYDGRLSWFDTNKLAATLHTSQIVDRIGLILVDLQWNNKRTFNIERFFSYLGPYISSLSISGATGNDVTTIMNYCPLVKSLKLKYCLIEGDLLCDLNLRKLFLNHCYFHEVRWNGITTLTHLGIEATAADVLQLDELLENNRCIEHIELCGSFEFNYTILAKLEELKSLHIGKQEEIVLSTIADLTKLRKLKLCGWQSENINRFLGKLGARPNVQELILEQLNCNCDTFTTLASTNLKSLILNNPEFHQLNDDLSGLTTQISNSIAHISSVRLTLNSIPITSDDMLVLIGVKNLLELNLYECDWTSISQHLPFIFIMQKLLDQIDDVLRKTEGRLPLILIMPKVLMFQFGKRFDINVSLMLWLTGISH